MPLSRRQLVLGALATAGGAAAWRAAGRSVPPGRLLGPSAAAGHRLRAGSPPPAPTARRQTRVVVLGGGVAGLAAAWRLGRRGERDVVVLELEAAAGGNAASGQSGVSAYPWGAHYVTIPGEGLTHVRRFYEEAGMITGYDAAGQALYDERALCAEPQERLLLHGRWQEGLVPAFGVGAGDQAQLRAFAAHVRDLRQARGRDGRRAFTLPVDASSRDPELLALDRLTMADYLARRGWDSPYLLWYVDYCCRDDFGATLQATSAWAGLHYFAARDGRAGNAAPNSVLTWPEGNGRLVRELAGRAGGQLATGKLVLSVTQGPAGVTVLYTDAAGGETVQLDAAAAVCCVPQFVARRIVAGLDARPPAGLSYAPWLVANVTVRSPPGGPGARLAWDNVPFLGPSLGYVVATHQTPRQYDAATVLTYYLPLTDGEPDAERHAAHGRSHGDWARLVLADLEAMHPGIAATVEGLDAWVWGHGMVRPTPGTLWGGARQAAAADFGRVAFAHSDLSGLSVFEEAFTRGAEAADRALGWATGAVRAAAR